MSRFIEINYNKREKIFKYCVKCGKFMFWNNYWECSNCKNKIYTNKNDCDGIVLV